MWVYKNLKKKKENIHDASLSRNSCVKTQIKSSFLAGLHETE